MVVVVVPDIGDLDNCMNKLNAKLLEKIILLSPARYTGLHQYFHRSLISMRCGPFSKARLDASVPPAPEEHKDLYHEMIRHWDCLNAELLGEVVGFLGDAELKLLWTEFEHNLKLFSETTLADCRRRNVRLPNDPHLRVEYDDDPKLFTLQKILDIKKFLRKTLKVDDAQFLGFTHGSVVLYFSIECQSASQLYSVVCDDFILCLKVLGIVAIAVPGYWEINIKYGQVSFTQVSVASDTL